MVQIFITIVEGLERVTRKQWWEALLLNQYKVNYDLKSYFEFTYWFNNLLFFPLLYKNSVVVYFWRNGAMVVTLNYFSFLFIVVQKKTWQCVTGIAVLLQNAKLKYVQKKRFWDLYKS